MRVKLCTACGAASASDSRFCAVCGSGLPSAANSDPLVGKIVGGSFVVQELIGVGGMGRVYRGEQNTLGRTVAIKVIHPHLHGDEHTVQRFYTEARASSRLNHPNSVSVIDFGRSDDGILYLVMEYLDGRDLAALMTEQGPLAIDRVIDFVSQTLEALAEAHELGIVHRDLKPENVLVVRSRFGNERVKVLDFGLATLMDGKTSVTRPGVVCGTPAYMSPEQARGEQVDARSDLYSVGAMLFEMLTDHPPYEAETPVKLLMKHVHDAIPDPRSVAPAREIPAPLAHVVMQALAKSPNERFQTATEMKRQLTDARRPSGVAARPDRPRVCVSCGASNDSSMRYCGSCGARLPGFSTGAGRRSMVPSTTPNSFVFVGRAIEMETIESWFHRAAQKALVGILEGEPGVGRTRLVTEMIERFESDGHPAALVGAHPSGVPVAYSMAIDLARRLLGLAANAKFVDITNAAQLGPLVVAGLEELDKPTGLRGIEGASRASAVGVALAWAARQALSRAPGKRLVIALDDLDWVDSLSRDAIARSALELVNEQVLYLAVGPLEVNESVTVERLTVTLLGDIEAHDMLDEPRVEEANPAFRVTPRVLAQLSAIREPLGSTFNRRGLRAADLAMARLERLDVPSRRFLQALAVVGRSAQLDLVKKVSGISDLAPVAELQARSLVTVDAGVIAFSDTFLAELVEAAIPAEARRLLHATALDALVERGAPSDVLAEHAALAAEGMRSMVFLERAGDIAMRRGDLHGAVRNYRRGVDLARKDALASGESMFDSARASFGRKLGEAMAALGDHLAADGILREILDMPEIDRATRGRIQLALARVARMRGRHEDATRQLVTCLELVSGSNPELEAQVQLEIGELRTMAGKWPQATNAFRRAIEILTPRDGDKSVLARAFARLAEGALVAGDSPACHAALLNAEREALRASSPAIAGRAWARVVAHPIAGMDPEEARTRAVALCSEAGDAEAFRQIMSHRPTQTAVSS